MRSNEERVAAVKRRIAQREKQRQRRRIQLVALSSTAASLALITGFSFLVPGIVAQVTCGEYDDFTMAANIFGNGVVLGYAVIALLAFVLGACVTVLCYRLRQFRPEDTDREDRTEDHDP